MKDLNKYLWVMVWWAIWDALWAPVEFFPIDGFEWIDEYHAGEGIRKWERTDDTAMSLLLADSLIRCNWTNLEDQLNNYLKRHETGYMWTQSYPMWEWVQVSRMLFAYEEYLNWELKEKPREKDLSNQLMDWNGSLMRIGPVPLFYYNDPEKALLYAWESSKTTHNTNLCIAACQYRTWLIIWAMNWVSKEDLLAPFYSPIPNYWINNPMPEFLGQVIRWGYKLKGDREIKPEWYVVDTLETCLWWFYKWKSFEDWLEKVVNLWRDSDTTWCIYGYLAGAYYWYNNIPEKRKKWLMQREKIENIAKQLYDLA